MQSQNNQKLLEIKNAEIKFSVEGGIVNAVNDISFDIIKGETLAIVGESGSGKTVTSLSIMGLLPNNAYIQEGNINLIDKKNNQVNILKLTDEKHNLIRGNDISMVFQEPMTCLNPTMTIGDQIVEVILNHKKISKTKAVKEMIDLLGLVEIPDPTQRAREYPHQLSGGMRQRVMISIALACTPKLIIADEPTSALDVTIQAQLLQLLMKLKNSIVSKTSILFITHDLGIVRELADRVIVMYGGVIQEIATIEELFKNPLHPYTKALMESIPKIDKKSKRLKALKGMVPSILELGDGCKLCSRFEPEECACGGTKVEPELTEVEKGHFARINTEMLKS